MNPVEQQRRHLDMLAGLDPDEPHRSATPAEPETWSWQIYDSHSHGEVNEQPHGKTLSVITADTVTARRVRWLWTDRLASGEIALLAGREGIGKSTLAYQLVADITRGRMPGEHQGQPRTVLVVADEDSWDHTIVPRLMAADAELRLVLRADPRRDGLPSSLVLPADISLVAQVVAQHQVTLILLDPLMSRVDPTLDTHKDQQVRLALTPLKQMAAEHAATVLGIIHVNKGHDGDPLNRVMASRAFVAVARHVLYVATDPDDDTNRRRLLGLVKNNLGPSDLPTQVFHLEARQVATDPDDQLPVIAPGLVWDGQDPRMLSDVLAVADEGAEQKSMTAEAVDWLVDFLTGEAGQADRATVITEGRKAGFGVDALKRARARAKVRYRNTPTTPRRTIWYLEEPP